MHEVLPSKQLYFGNHLRAEVNIQEESRNLIILNDRIVCFRIPSSRELHQVEQSGLPVVTLVDDHYWGIVKDRRLPLGYRSRMLRRLINNWRRLRHVTDKWVVTSPALEKLYPGASLVDPNWDIPSDCGNRVNQNGLHIGFLGTRSHLHDLEYILAGIISFLHNFPAARFTLFMGKHCPKELLTLSNVTNYNPMSWLEYRKLLRGLKIDISLLPSQSSEVNKCRSRNKLFEAVYAGGFCLFDERYTHKDYALKYDLGVSFRPSNVGQTLKTYMNDDNLLTGLKNTAKDSAHALQAKIIDKQKAVLLG